jgi:hypothetical protein
MRFFFMLLLLPPLCQAEHVVIDFQEVSSYYPDMEYLPISLDHFFDGGPGGNYGFLGMADSYIDAFVVGGSLLFPLHGPNALYVKGGFEGCVSFEYSGYLGNPEYRQSILLRRKGRLVTEYRIPQTEFGSDSTVTINFKGLADEMDFGIDPNGNLTGNAGDMHYKYFEFSNLHRPEPVEPHDPPAKPAPPVPVRTPAPMRAIDGTSFRSQIHGRSSPVR